LSYEAHKEYKDKLNQKNDIKFRLNKKKDLIQEQINYNRTDNLENNDQKAQLIRHKQIKELREKKAKMQNIQVEHL
jgi:hypothetical protein